MFCQVRAKAVLLRDLEEARAKRIALENPPPEVVEGPIKLEPQADLSFTQENTMAADDQHPLQPKLEDTTATMPVAVESQGLVGDAAAKAGRGPPAPSPSDVNTKVDVADADKVPGTNAELSKTDQTVEPSVDSLLVITADSNNDDLNLTFDDMDFSQFTSNMEDNSQSQTNEDFLSTFGNEHFTMPGLQDTSAAGNSTNNAEDKKEDLLEMAANSGGHDMMDLDYFKPADESSFEELFTGGDEVNVTDGGNTENDNYDSAFYNPAG